MYDDDFSEQELSDRLSLIESMIAEGRRSVESWGWMFVLWGVVYYAAMAWSLWGHNVWAWPVTVSIGIVIAIFLASSKANHRPPTTLSRAIISIWIAMGISMFLLFAALGWTGRLMDQHVFVAVISALLGVANGASALILRWKLQLACAIVWWATAAASCFGTDAQCTAVFLVATFLCQIVFGLYGVIGEAHKRKRRPLHA